MKNYLIPKLLSGRTHLAFATLMLLLQRTPALKLITYLRCVQSATPVARILQSLAIPAAAAAIPHAVSGASTSTYSVQSSNIDGLKVGIEVDIQFSISITPASWSISGDIPPGLRITDLRQRLSPVDGVLASYRGLITGIPTQAGTYRLTLTPWEFADGTGTTAPNPLALTLTVAPGELAEPPVPPSQPQIQYTTQNQSLQLIWQNNPKAPYALTVSTDLKTWTPIDQSPSLGNGEARIEVPLSTPQNTFYRLSSP